MLRVPAGVWATQAHNEVKLSEAFGTCDDVLLIFSVNGSGQFQGYARMAGPVKAEQVWCAGFGLGILVFLLPAQVTARAAESTAHCAPLPIRYQHPCHSLLTAVYFASLRQTSGRVMHGWGALSLWTGCSGWT